MRIAVWYWGRRGGGAHYTAALVEALAQRTDVTVCAHVSSALSTLDRLSCALPTMVTAHVHTRRGLAGAISVGTTSITEFVRRERPDVILQTMTNPVSPLAWPALRRTGVPVVTVIHDAIAHPGDRHRGMEASSRFWMTASSRLVAPSEHVAATVRDRTRTPVDVVPLGPHVLLDDLWDPEGFVLFLGRMRAYKGLDLLANAWLSLDLADRTAGLRVIGEATNDPGLLRSLALLRAAGASVDARWISDDAIAGIIAGARLIVLPYKEASQSGVVTLARSARIPILATNVGGLAEQVGHTGVLVEPTAAALAGGLRMLLQDRTALAALHADECKETDQDRWRVITDVLLATLEKVAPGKSPV